MFRLNEVYENGAGSSVRILCVDSKIMYAGKVSCPIVGEVTSKGGTYANGVQYYSADGRYAGLVGKEYDKHSLISNDPTEEETALIRDIQELCEKEGATSEKLLKVIRQLRKK